MDIQLDDIGIIVLVAIFVAEKIFSWLKGRGVDLQKMARTIEDVPKIKVKVDQLHEMHKYPDEHGFGTHKTNDQIAGLIHEMQALTGSIAELAQEIRLERKLLQREHAEG